MGTFGSIVRRWWRWSTGSSFATDEPFSFGLAAAADGIVLKRLVPACETPQGVAFVVAAGDAIARCTEDHIVHFAPADEPARICGFDRALETDVPRLHGHFAVLHEPGSDRCMAIAVARPPGDYAFSMMSARAIAGDRNAEPLDRWFARLVATGKVPG